MPLALAFLVGLADLAAELAVFRTGRLGLGAASYATTALLGVVLASFGIGAALATRLRGPRAFAALRLASAIGASTGLFGTLAAAGSPGAAASAAPALAIASAAFFAIPAGASVPLLYPWARSSPWRAALLVAAGASGGVLGAWAGGVLAPTQLGSWGTSLSLVALNLGAGALALVSRSAWRGETAPPPPAVGANEAAALLTAGAAGALTVALESLLGRVVPFFLSERSDALATLLGAALLGVTVGALASGAWLRRARLASAGVGLLGAASLAGMAALLALDLLARVQWLSAPGTAGRFRGARLIVGLALVTLPVAAAGALSPLAFALASGEDRRRVARLNIAYAIGALIPVAAIPPLLDAGFSTPSLIGATGLLILPAALVLLGVRGIPLLVPVISGALLGAGALPLRVPPFRGRPWLSLLESREGPVGVASVVADLRRNDRTLFTNAFRAAATGDDYRYTRALAHLPILYCGRPPERIAVIAVGTGSTAAAALRHGTSREVSLVEISDEVFELTRLFSPASDALFVDGPDPERRFDPRVRRCTEDGRRFLAAEGEPFDVITLEPLLPDTPGAYPFYTRELYALARARLAPGGVLAQWIPIHAMEPRSLRALLATFAQAFPHRSLFLIGMNAILLGSDRPITLAKNRLEAAMTAPTLAADLRRSGCSTAGDLVAQCVLGDEGLASFATEYPLTDEWARIERLGFVPPREELRYEPENLEALIQARAAARTEALPGMEALEAGEAEARRGAGTAYLRARKAAAQLEQARLNNDPIASQDADNRARAAALSDATAHPFAALDGLRSARRRDLLEGRTALASGDMRTAIPALERAARPMLDPMALLALATAYAAAGRMEDGERAAATALVLAPFAAEVAPREWKELVGPLTADAFAGVVERGRALAARVPHPPSTIEATAEGLASAKPEERVAAEVALARRREALSVQTEVLSGSTVTLSPAKLAAALAVGRALQDPTLTSACARLDAALKR